MIKAKDCLRSLAPWMVTCVGIGLSVLEAGCSTMSGLRSVGTERPSILGLWDRPAGTPTPESDSYVLSMRAGKARAAELARRKDAPASGETEGPSDGGDMLTVGTEDARARRRNAPKNSASPDDDNTIRVSLGRPEPLPGVALALAPPGRQKSTEAGAQWKADKSEPPVTDIANVSQPDQDQEIDATKRARQVHRDQLAPNGDWQGILSRAEAKLDSLQTYQMKVSRLERVNGQLQPEEEILLSIRRDPKAVRLEWTSGPSKGREVIYSSALDPRMIFVHIPPTAIPLPVMKIPVDSPLVMRNSRHAITEAGFDTIVDNLRKSERGGDKSPSNPGVLSYHGTEKPAGLTRSCYHFVRRTATGETWNIYLDERSLLPSMVFAQDARGSLIERYIYRDIRENPTDLAVAAAFEPDQRWGESRGLLGRLARAASGNSLPSGGGPTTR